MKRLQGLKKIMAVCVMGGCLYGPGCVQVFQESVVDGFVNYFRRGGVVNSLDTALLSDFILNAFTGGFTGDTGGGSGGGGGENNSS